MGNIQSVQIKKGQVRKAPSFLSTVLKNLSYADTVSVIKEQDGWKQIKATKSGVTGWMHSSALTVKKIILKSGEEDVKSSASSEEYALAGKGFNKAVEDKNKERNPHLNFAWIDKMETFNVSERRMRQFLRQGKVVPQGGTA